MFFSLWKGEKLKWNFLDLPSVKLGCVRKLEENELVKRLHSGCKLLHNTGPRCRGQFNRFSYT